MPSSLAQNKWSIESIYLICGEIVSQMVVGEEAMLQLASKCGVASKLQTRIVRHSTTVGK
jgi:hypothetical protein